MTPPAPSVAKTKAALIIVKDGKLFVSSVTIAREFGRRHKHVLDTIDSLIADSTLAGPDFRPSQYVDESGKSNRCFDLDEDGFLIAMPFIGGKKAREGQRRLVKEFSALRRAMVRKAETDWQQARLEGKDARRHETDTIATFVEYAIGQGSRNAPRYYRNITDMTYKALFMVEQGLKMPSGLRDLLDGMQLSFLASAEYVCANAIKDGMARNLPYKDIYVFAKDRVEAFAVSVGRTKALPSRDAACLGLEPLAD